MPAAVAVAPAACTAAARCATAAAWARGRRCGGGHRLRLVGGGLHREGRSTMVFSKSAFSPAGAGGAGAASPMNFSLYLPSSMTSLFCRKCFLIVLPLTNVPLVLPRSSRNESFEDGDDDGVLAAHRQIVDLDVVVRLAADGGALLGQRNLLEHQPVHAEYQLRHS